MEKDLTDKLSEFFKHIKERYSSPLFSSYVVSWLVFHWRIPVLLFFHSSNEIKPIGYSSFVDVIEQNCSFQSSLGLSHFSPLWAALLYTFCYPFVRIGITAFNTQVSKWGDNLNLGILGDGKISIEKYLKLRQSYKERTAFLEKTIEDEKGIFDENQKMKDETISLKTYLQEARNNLSEALNEKNSLRGELNGLYGKKEDKIKILALKAHTEKYEIEPTVFKHSNYGVSLPEIA